MLISIRDEDYNVTPINGKTIKYDIIELVMSETEAEQIYNTLTKYYICCFTYNSQISNDHWEEYGSESDGVLIGIKTDWFLRKAIFMCGDNSKCNDEATTVLKNYDEAFKSKVVEQQKLMGMEQRDEL